jgi:hypothetical protein
MITTMKRTIYRAAGFLGLLAGLLCLVFAVLSFLGHIPELFASPLGGLTRMVNAAILGITGFLILGAARMTKSGGHRATTGGIYLLIFGVVAYLVGGAIGATLTLVTGVLAITARYL